ncbi:MAG: neutral/alkaline non-lysosomal ceramidase N-terminal domain-containing protein [Chitinophagaceae bacterium]
MGIYSSLSIVAFHAFALSLLVHTPVVAQVVAGNMEVGVSRVDITPVGPMRMGGHIRKTGSKEGVLPFDKALHKLYAKSLAFGSDAQKPTVLISCDLIGIPGYITKEVASRLSAKMGLDSSRLAITTSHTHAGPEVGNLLSLTRMYSDPPVTAEEMAQIGRYISQLTDNLEKVALEALKTRAPALVSWGQGKASFAVNRRLIENGKWVAQRYVPKGPVDHSLPFLRITDLNGKLRAVFMSYACHGTTLGGDNLNWNGDWNGAAQRLIEANHPHATALIAMGCGADANPYPAGKLINTIEHGKEMADEVERLLALPLQPLNAPPVAAYKVIQLPFAHVPTVDDLAQSIKEGGPKAYNAAIFLEQLIKGVPIDQTLSYPVQTWTFGNDMAMLFLGGEVVSDYSLRLKKEIGAERLWVNAYANDVRCYIPSRRVLREGGYEAEGHIYYYNQPSRLDECIEDMIIATVHELLPTSFKAIKGNTSDLLSEINAAISLDARNGKPVGPTIRYMPDLDAYEGFTSSNSMEWNVKIPKKGNYDVYLEWSVSDSTAGHAFLFKAGNQEVGGTIQKTGGREIYKAAKIGLVKLPAGVQKMIFKPTSPGKEASLNFRGVTLVPAN